MDAAHFIVREWIVTFRVDILSLSLRNGDKKGMERSESVLQESVFNSPKCHINYRCPDTSLPATSLPQTRTRNHSLIIR